MVNIEIDGLKVEAQDGAMLIEAADAVGISIPRFCYHKKLSVAANCRMCLVDVEKAAKPLPACATPVTEGMKVLTQSHKAISAQKGVMEFLLINHPLDCPICDQGGECDLQDLAVGYGASHSRYNENKRVVKNQDIGPLIATDMTRCIHCTRCVRFGEEIAGIRELGATGRGEHMEIGTYVANTLSSELSGNVIDLCPVGALTSKPFRYSARSWEMQRHPSIAGHDCVGSNIDVDVRNNSIMRVVPRENETINETWLSDRDRFAYEGLNKDRLTVPMIKQSGEWQRVSWDTALEFTLNGMKDLIGCHGAEQLAALISPGATLEEMYLLQKLVRGLGSSNIDHRIRQLDFSEQNRAPVFPYLGQSIESLGQSDAVLLVGANITKDQPILGHRIRQAAVYGAKIMCINSNDYNFNMPLAEKITVDATDMEVELAGIAKALLKTANKNAIPSGIDKLLKSIKATSRHEKIAAHLSQAKHGSILLGLSATNHPAFSTLYALAECIAALSGAKLGSLSLGANSAGAWLSGAVPHRMAVTANASSSESSAGLNATQMFAAPRKGYFLFGVEPEFDSADPVTATESLKDAEFVVSFSSYSSEALNDVADVFLPISPYTETSGTFVNIEGRWQSFNGVVSPQQDTRPAWRILRVLGNLFELDGFEYMSSIEVRDELKEKMGELDLNNNREWQCPDSLGKTNEGVSRIEEVPIYGTDAIVRRATSLLNTSDAMSVAMNQL